MKTRIFMFTVVMIITACGQRTQEPLVMTNEVDSLVSVINERDASLNNFLAANADIERNLDEIVAREGAIKMSVSKDNELKGTSKERVDADIEAINNLMKQNREKIDQLNAKLSNSKVKSKEADQMIQHLNDRLAGKDAELASLNNQLASANATVARLQTSVNYLSAKTNAQAQTIVAQTNALHTAYFIVDNSKTLRDKSVINKTGGLLGIGRTSQLDPNMNVSDFTRIDYTITTDINIDSKNVKIITQHPADSYSLTKEENKVTAIHINDPEKFWRASKYLVVAKD